MKIYLLLFLVLFVFTLKSFSQEINNLKKLQWMIESQIKEDKINQKDIINLILPFELKVSDLNTPSKSMSLQKNDFKRTLQKSTSFFHIGGYYLRLYLIASNKLLNNAKLEFIRDNSSENKPDQLIKELNDDSSDTKVSFFDYHITKKIEKFHLILKFESKKPGRALALVTMIPDNEYKSVK